MLGVVPGDEVAGPGPGPRERVKALRGQARPGFDGAEERLGERVVIADPGPAETGEDAHAPQGLTQGLAPHGPPVVRAQHQAGWIERMALARAADEPCGV